MENQDNLVVYSCSDVASANLLLSWGFSSLIEEFSSKEN